METISAREPVQRGRIVNLTWGPEEHRVTERHEAADIDKVRAVMMADAAKEAGGLNPVPAPGCSPFWRGRVAIAR